MSSSFSFLKIFLIININSYFLGGPEAAQILTSPMVSNAGRWGEFQHCPPNSKVIAVQVKTEPWDYWNTFTDDTCMNGVRFICGNEVTREHQGSITSSQGQWGNWGQIFHCGGQSQGYVIGFMTRAEEQGTAALDETATNNLRILCAGSPNGFMELDGEVWGEWTNPRICDSHEYICGLQTQVEEYQGIWTDDSALNNIRVECCNLSEDDLLLYGLHANNLTASGRN